MRYHAVTGLLGLGFLVGSLMAQSAPPSVSDLKKLKFEASSTEPAGLPDHDKIQAAVESFQMYKKGAAIGAKWNRPPRERGPIDTSIYHRAVPAVVYIAAISDMDGDNIKSFEEGAGVILHPSGTVLSNWHVVREAYENKHEILVFFKPAGDNKPAANLAYAVDANYWNATKDLALLEFRQKIPFTMTGLDLGDKSKVDVGQNVHIIGHPLGAKNAWSYSTGVVSAVRDGFETNLKEGAVTQPLNANVIQIQTSINPGNSGGPVMDDNTLLIGLVSFTPGGSENLHYAIAVDEIAALLARRTAYNASHTRGGEVPEVHFSAAKLSDGRRVLKAQYPNKTAYIVLDSSEKPVSMVIESPSGTVIEAWEPADGGFNQWRAKYRDGGVAEATGAAGKPARFTLK